MDAAKGYTVFFMRPDSVKNNSPRLPRLFAAPFSLLPNPVHSRLIALALNKALEEQIREGELDFLQHRSLAIKVRDAGITFALTFDGNRLMARGHGGVSDLSIAGTVYDFLLLVGREEDPDTLVFQRRLVMQGDTEFFHTSPELPEQGHRPAIGRQQRRMQIEAANARDRQYRIRKSAGKTGHNNDIRRVPAYFIHTLRPWA